MATRCRRGRRMRASNRRAETPVWVIEAAVQAQEVAAKAIWAATGRQPALAKAGHAQAEGAIESEIRASPVIPGRGVMHLAVAGPIAPLPAPVVRVVHPAWAVRAEVGAPAAAEDGDNETIARTS